jgi:hypothetical protein
MRDKDDPKPLHFTGDDEPTLTRAEADVAGISMTPEVVYGDNSFFPNEDDQRDANEATEDEHV